MDGRQRLERGDPVGVLLADPGQDAARERDPQLAGRAQAGQPRGRGLGRGSLVGDEVVADGLEHEALRRGDLAQPREVLVAQDAEVRVREQAALQRALARPRDVGGEVRVPPRGQALADGRVDLRLLAGEDEQLLDVALRGAVEQPQDLLRLVEVRLVGLERAVLAEALARPRQREREVPRERDAAPHGPESTDGPPRAPRRGRDQSRRSGSSSMPSSAASSATASTGERSSLSTGRSIHRPRGARTSAV